MNSPTAEMIKAARKGAEVARYLRWGPTIEGRHLMNAVAAYEEAIEALRELHQGAKEYLDYIEQFDVFNDADYEMSGLGSIDANLKGSMVHAGNLLAKAKEQER